MHYTAYNQYSDNNGEPIMYFDCDITQRDLSETLALSKGKDHHKMNTR